MEAWIGDKLAANKLLQIEVGPPLCCVGLPFSLKVVVSFDNLLCGECIPRNLQVSWRVAGIGCAHAAVCL